MHATAPNKTVSYSITGGTGMGLFDINAGTGAVTVHSGAVLDREAAASYTPDVNTLSLHDALPISTQTVTVSLNDVNDNTPSISSSAAMSVDENAAGGTAVGTVAATDADATAPNKTVSYSITGGTGMGLFDINAGTGAVTVHSGAVLDREAAASYTLDVKAADGGTPSLFTTQTVTVSLNDVNDNAPTISTATATTVAENTAATTAVDT